MKFTPRSDIWRRLFGAVLMALAVSAGADDQLDRKFTVQCEPVLGKLRAAQALALWRRIETLASVRESASACTLP